MVTPSPPPQSLGGDQAVPSGSHLPAAESSIHPSRVLCCCRGRADNVPTPLTLPSSSLTAEILRARQGKAEAAAPSAGGMLWHTQARGAELSPGAWAGAAAGSLRHRLAPEPRTPEIKHCNDLTQHLERWTWGSKVPGTVYFTSPFINLSGYLAAPSLQYFTAPRPFQ